MPRRIDIDPEKLLSALRERFGDRAAVAAALGVSVATLRRRIYDYRLADEIYYASRPGLREAERVEDAFWKGPYTRRRGASKVEPVYGYYDFLEYEVMTAQEIAAFVERRPEMVMTSDQQPRRPR